MTMGDYWLEISTKGGLATANVTYKAAVRTTLCDIMCTSNTIGAYHGSKREKLKSLVATMPYEKSKTINGPIKGATLYQKMRVNDITVRKTEELKRSRDEFVQKMKREKYEKDIFKNIAAAKIQALFRGFRARPKKIDHRKPKKTVILTQSELYDELCAMAAKLDLPPIPGLSLEARSKASKRKRKIETAATFRIQRFFKMLVARRKARARLDLRRIEIVDDAARRITKFFRFIKNREALKRYEQKKKGRLLLMLQCGERVRQARARVRVLRQRKQESYKKNEAAIIIQRNFAPKYRSMNLARVVRLSFKAISVMADAVLEGLFENLVSELLSIGIQQPAKDILSVEWPIYLSALRQAEIACIEQSLDDLMFSATKTWIEDKIKFFEAERRRVSEMAENIHMAEEDLRFSPAVSTHSKQPEGEELVSQTEERESAPVAVDAVTDDRKEEEEALAKADETDDTYDDEQQLGMVKSGRTPRSVRSHLPSPGRPTSTTVEEEGEELEETSHSRRSSFTSVISFSDDPAAPEFNLVSSVANFVSKIASKIIQRTIGPTESDRNSNRSLEEDDKSTARSMVSFPDEASSQLSFRGSVRDFVSKISDKVITKVVAPEKSGPTLRNNTDLVEEGEEDSELVAVAPAPTEELSNVLGTSAFESTEPSQSVDPATQLTSSISQFMAAINEQSIVQPSEDILLDSIIHEDTLQTKASARSDSSGSRVSAPEGTHTASIELVESISDEAIPVSITSQVRKSRTDSTAESNPPLPRIYTENITSISMSDDDKDQIEICIEDALRQFAYAKFEISVQALNFADGVMDALPPVDQTHAEFLALRALITLIKANSFFAVADYENSKALYDYVFQVRVDIYGADHILVAEVEYHLAEWHRSQALYSQAEELFSQAISILQTSLKDMSESDLYPIILLSKIYIGCTELLRNSGQYFKANDFLKEAQNYVRSLKNQNALSFELQGEFICCLVSLLLLKGKISNAIVLHQELLDKRMSYFKTMNKMREDSEETQSNNADEPIPHPKLASSMAAMGSLLLTKCEYIEACKLIEDSLSIRRQVYPPDHPAIASSLYLKATAFIAFGKYQDAAIEMANSLEIRLKKLGQNHPSVAQSLTGIANIQTLLGYPNDAVPNYFKGLTIRKERFGVDSHRDVADSLFKLGLNAEARGSYLEAVSYIENALQLQEALLPLFGSEVQSQGGHIAIEWIKVHLAYLFTKVSRIEEAKSIMKTSVKCISKVLGQGNALVAQSLCFLGELCRIRGNYFDAKTLFSLSFSTANLLYGDNHPDVSRVLLESGENFRISGFYTEASELISTALDINLILFGRDNLAFAKSLFRRAQILRDSDQLVEAEQLYFESLTIVSNRIGEKNGLFGIMLADLCECYRLMKKKEIAEEKFLIAIEVLKSSNGEGSLIVAETLCNYCNLMVDIRNPNAAIKILKESVLPVFDSILGYAHPWSMYSRANFAVAELLNSLNSMIASQVQQYQSVNESFITNAIQSVKSRIATHPDIIDFLNYCRQSSFSPQHPWVLRFSSDSDGDLASHLSTDYFEETSYGSGSLGYYSSAYSASSAAGAKSIEESFVSTSMTASDHDTNRSSIYDDDSISLDATVSPRYRTGETESLRSDLSQISNSNTAMTPRTRANYEEENSNFSTTPRSSYEDRSNSIADGSTIMSPSIEENASLVSNTESYTAGSSTYPSGSRTVYTTSESSPSGTKASFIRADSLQSSIVSGANSESYYSQGQSNNSSSLREEKSSRKGSDSGNSVFSRLSPSVANSETQSTSYYTDNSPHTYHSSASELQGRADDSGGSVISNSRGTPAGSMVFERQPSTLLVDGIASVSYEVSEHSTRSSLPRGNESSQTESAHSNTYSATSSVPAPSLQQMNQSPTNSVHSTATKHSYIDDALDGKMISRPNSRRESNNESKPINDSSLLHNSVDADKVSPRSSSSTGRKGSGTGTETVSGTATFTGHSATQSGIGTGADSRSRETGSYPSTGTGTGDDNRSRETGSYLSSRTGTGTYTTIDKSRNRTESHYTSEPSGSLIEESRSVEGNISPKPSYLSFDASASLNEGSQSDAAPKGSQSEAERSFDHNKSNDLSRQSSHVSIIAGQDKFNNASSIENIPLDSSVLPTDSSLVKTSDGENRNNVSMISSGSAGMKSETGSNKSHHSAAIATPINNRSVESTRTSSHPHESSSFIDTHSVSGSEARGKELAGEESSLYASEGFASYTNQSAETDGDSYTQFSPTDNSPRSLTSERQGKSLSKASSPSKGSAKQRYLATADDNYEEDFESVEGHGA